MAWNDWDGEGEKAGPRMAGPRLALFGRSFALPRARGLRIGLGVLLVFFGILGFLPVLGFWMVPLGLLVLSRDLPAVRRWRRRVSVWWGRRRERRAARAKQRP